MNINEPVICAYCNDPSNKIAIRVNTVNLCFKCVVFFNTTAKYNGRSGSEEIEHQTAYIRDNEMTQEQLDEVMWKSTPDWQKDQLREERAELLWEQQKDQLREDRAELLWEQQQQQEQLQKPLTP